MQQIMQRENKIGRAQEHFWVVGLNNTNKILFIELIGLGRQNRVAANPPDVFRMAIYKLAVKMILVHNHPSGEMTPSMADREMTDRMLKVSEHVLFGGPSKRQSAFFLYSSSINYQTATSNGSGKSTHSCLLN